MSSTSVQHDLLEWARAALSSWPVHDPEQATLRAAYLAHLQAAALREATEESGMAGLRVVGPADLHRHALSAAFGRCREHLDAAYVVQAPYGARPEVGPESLDVAWWPVGDLPEAVVPDLPVRLERILATA